MEDDDEHGDPSAKCDGGSISRAESYSPTPSPGSPYVLLPRSSASAEPGVFLCSHCHKAFRTEAGRIHHEKMHEGQGFSCDFCERTFSQKHHMRRHMLSHNGIPCDICQETFVSQMMVMKHMEESHGISISSKPNPKTKFHNIQYKEK